MQLQQDTGNKQHILAEDSLGNTIIPSLSNLFITNYPDCTVLAIFSSLEKKLLAYKITNPVEQLHQIEQWFHEDFNRTVTLSFTHLYELTPELFSTETYKTHNSVTQMLVSFQSDDTKNPIHYLAALIQYHLLKSLKNQLYLFRDGDYCHVLLMNEEQCLLANSFVCENEHEVLYFLLNTLQISDILPSDTTLNTDYSLANDPTLLAFLKPHFSKTEVLNYHFEGINSSIPLLAEKLFACYAASLCA